MDDFYNDLKRGKRGETMVAAALAARGHKVIDLSDDLEARKNDIDLLLVNKQQQTTTLEIKNDQRSENTGNLFIETYNSNNKSHSFKGWFFYCRAEFLCFLQEGKRTAHIVALDELKKNIAANAYRTANSSNASGYLVPLEAVKSLPSYFCMAV